MLFKYITYLVQTRCFWFSPSLSQIRLNKIGEVPKWISSIQILFWFFFFLVFFFYLLLFLWNTDSFSPLRLWHILMEKVKQSSYSNEILNSQAIKWGIGSTHSGGAWPTSDEYCSTSDISESVHWLDDSSLHEFHITLFELLTIVIWAIKETFCMHWDLLSQFLIHFVKYTCACQYPLCFLAKPVENTHRKQKTGGFHKSWYFANSFKSLNTS